MWIGKCLRKCWRRQGPMSLTQAPPRTKVRCIRRSIMKNLVGTVVFLLALSGLVSAQAAVEGALAHALSGGTTAAAGKALRQVENQLAGRLGQQTSNAVRPKVNNVRPGAQKSVKVPQTTATTATSPLANGGS